MRLHRLSLTAFGPFPGTVEVDLDEAGRDGLFLLWGPTGAGKTTLLDAVVFALYGTVPGARGEEKRLRSDHADADTRTEVSCELTLGGERLLVIRRPEQQRPKKRGEGWTTEQAKLTVQRLTDGGWAPVSTPHRRGLGAPAHPARASTSDQFCQVVLLPQGDFARFLRAEPEHRGELLRTLFDVDRFARAEDWLADERGRPATRVAVRQARLSDAAGPGGPDRRRRGPRGARAGARRGRPGHARARGCTGPDGAGGAATPPRRCRAEEAAVEAGAIDGELASARALDDRHARRDRAAAELDS